MLTEEVIDAGVRSGIPEEILIDIINEKLKLICTSSIDVTSDYGLMSCFSMYIRTLLYAFNASNQNSEVSSECLKVIMYAKDFNNIETWISLLRTDVFPFIVKYGLLE